MKLETFFEKFDQFADAPDAVAKMRELVLEWAVQGRLVPQDSTEETAQALLERVSSTAKTRRQGSDELDGAHAPFAIPETWAWVRLPRVLNKLTDGTHHSPPNGPSGAFMYVTAKNIKTDGILLDGITYVSKEVHDEIYSRCDPSFGDVLYIKDGATTGIATINQVKEPFSMLSSVALLKPSEAIFNRYLLWAMRSPFFYAEIPQETRRHLPEGRPTKRFRGNGCHPSRRSPKLGSTHSLVHFSPAPAPPPSSSPRPPPEIRKMMAERWQVKYESDRESHAG